MDERLRDGTVIRPSPFSMVVAMITLLFGGSGLFLLWGAIHFALMGGLGYLVPLGLALMSLPMPYLMIWRYFVVIAPETVADAYSRRRPKQVVPREAIARARWFDNGSKMGGLFLDESGAVVMSLAPYISVQQVKKIAAMLGVPFEG